MVLTSRDSTPPCSLRLSLGVSLYSVSILVHPAVTLAMGQHRVGWGWSWERAAEPLPGAVLD